MWTSGKANDPFPATSQNLTLVGRPPLVTVLNHLDLRMKIIFCYYSRFRAINRITSDVIPRLKWNTS